VGLVSFLNQLGNETGWIGFGASANANATFMNNRAGGNTSLGAGGLERLTVTPVGKVGINTTVPQESLDVRGNIKLGASGQLFASGGEENLRIVRGSLDQNGNILAGSGFQVTHDEFGYTITFDQPFAGMFTMTVTVRNVALPPLYTPITFPLGPNAIQVSISGDAFLGSSPIDSPFDFIAIGPR